MAATITVRKVRSVLENHYDAEVRPQTRGSHWKVFRKGRRPYTLPAKNGLKTPVSNKYIKAMCRQLEIDESEFRGHLD